MAALRSLLALIMLSSPAFAQDAASSIPIAPTKSPTYPTLIRMTRVALQCSGGAPSLVRDAVPNFVTSWGPGRNLQPVVLNFRIDASGRPLSIRQAPDAATGWRGPGAAETSPALAAMRFAPGAARSTCTATYNPVSEPLKDAARTDLARYWATPHASGPYEKQVFARLRPEGGDCGAPAPQRRTLQFPDLKSVQVAQGNWDYALITYDLDRAGKPVRVRVLESSGNDVIDARSLAAVKASRFAAEPRTGCLVRFRRAGEEVTAAPDAPPISEYRSESCKALPDWADMAKLPFPEAFRRRKIEGWAVIGFDVAPWGSTGNVRVLASEPSIEFGEQAAQIVTRAKLPASEKGLTGCAERVRFVIRKAEAAQDESEPPAPF